MRLGKKKIVSEKNPYEPQESESHIRKKEGGKSVRTTAQERRSPEEKRRGEGQIQVRLPSGKSEVIRADTV